MKFELKRCLRCGSVRNPDLARVAPCEYCGAARSDVETHDLPAVDDSWDGTLGRERYEDDEGGKTP